MFNFSSLQKKGIIVLIIILLLMFATRQILSHIVKETVDYANEVPISSIPTSTTPPPISNTSTVSSYTRPPVPPKKTFTVDANTADTLDLQEIRGIGSVLARRIVNYRNLLGGFIAKEQLLEVWGIDSTKYAVVKDAFVLKNTQITKININTVDIQTLKKHPYMDYYLAKAIVQDREKNGLFDSLDDLLRVEMLDNPTFMKIKPYLSVN
jgi:DNA uptake protein ComE-like DNA-binding protein